MRLTTLFPDINQTELYFIIMAFFGGLTGFIFQGFVGFIVGAVVTYCVSKIISETITGLGLRL